MCHRQWATRGYFTKDFEKLSEEAKQLSRESTRIKKDLDYDDRAGWSVKIAGMHVVTTAIEWDTGIGIALAAWDGIMHPNEGRQSDIES